MDLSLIETCTTAGGPWLRADRLGGDKGGEIRDRLADSIGEQAADGRDQGNVRVGGETYLWRFTAAATRQREKDARAQIATRCRGKTGAEWLSGDEGRGLLRVAGWSGLAVAEVVETCGPAPEKRGKGKRGKVKA